MDNIVTIERFILNNQPETAVGDFTNLLYDIALAAKAISAKMLRAGLIEILGQAGSTNVQGEEQQKLDLYADQIMVKLCDHTGRLCVMASEEHKDIILIPESYPKGRYVLVFDPLDGSSNIDVNVSVGTIFSIYRRVTPVGTPVTLKDFLQKGSQQVAAGYVIYGTSTMIVYTTGAGVNGFTLNPAIGTFYLSHPDMQFPVNGKIYSVNEGNYIHFPQGVKNYIKYCQMEDGDRPYTSRYIGSLVSDFHRNMIKGGIYLYPKSSQNEAGKLRLLYECNPMAFIAEQAGGKASDGFTRIMDIEPTELHQRVPFFCGSKNMVEKAEEFMRQSIA